jgi:hypothetical protein
VWNNSGVYNNSESRNFDASNGRAEFNISGITRDDYEWNCLSCDENNNCSFSESNYTFKIDYNNVSLNNPSQDYYTNKNQTFNCSAETDPFKRLSNITLFIMNSTNNIYNETVSISGFINSSTFYHNFTSEGDYEWNCLVYNNHSESSFSVSNYTLTYDITSPTITLISPPNSASYTGSRQINFRFNVSEDNISNCSLILDGAVSLTNNLVNASVTQQFTKSMGPGAYNWKIECADLAGNEKQSPSYSLTINSDISINSGGGGGTPTETAEETPELNEEQPSDDPGLIEEPSDENEQITAFEEEPIENNLNTLSSRLIGAAWIIIPILILSIIIFYIIFRTKNEKTKTKSQRKEKIPAGRRKRRR